MRRHALVLVLILVIPGLAACGGGGDDPTFDAPPSVIPPTEDSTRDIVSTDLAIDVTALTAVATITLAPSTSMGASFEIGDLAVTGVTRAGAPLEFADQGDRLD